MFVKSTVVVALLASFVAAQSTANSTIDPNSVPASTRSNWCNGQINTCGTLCSGDPSANDCNPDNLVFNCTCSANSSVPGLQYYTQTMPTFICEMNFQNCITAGVGDAAAQKLCNENEIKNCGHNDPSSFVAAAPSSSSSSSASPTATPTVSSTASTTSASASASKAAAASLIMGQNYGTGILAAAVAAALGYLL